MDYTRVYEADASSRPQQYSTLAAAAAAEEENHHSVLYSYCRALL